MPISDCLFNLHFSEWTLNVWR